MAGGWIAYLVFNMDEIKFDRDGMCLIQGDCLEVMKTIPDKSIDLVLTDPPYEMIWREPLKISGRKTMFHHKVETQKWDKGVKKLYPKLFKIFDKLLISNGSIITFIKIIDISWIILIAKEFGFKHKATIIWHKPNPMPQVRKKNYISSFETILWLSRHNEEKCDFIFNFAYQKEMHNFIEMPLCGGNERTEHPTQKPRKLISHLLQIHSNKNDTILDPFMGSGTTGVAAKELGRRFIGIEICERYYNIAKKRIDNTMPNLL